MRLEAVGYGAGSRDPDDMPNVVRLMLGSAPARRSGGGETLPERDLLIVEANLDDLTPELVADAARALLAAGALDVWTTPVIMKKGRPAMVLSALSPPELEDRLSRVFFEATTTFGLRSYPIRRTELDRRVVTVTVEEAPVRVKLGLIGARIVSAKPEHDDLVALADQTGRSIRSLATAAAIAAHDLGFDRTAQ
jgi:uncharacterized protein (DUF111 family)